MVQQKRRLRVAVIGLGAIGRPLRDVTAHFHDVVGHDRHGSDNWPGVLATDVAFVCVGTPPDNAGRLDHADVSQVLVQLSSDRYQGVVAIRSTLGIGGMAHLRRRHPSLRLVYTPEFVRERSAFLWTANPDRVVLAGERRDCDLVLEALCWIEDTPVLRMSDSSAELGKLAHNAYIAYKITFANLMGHLAKQVDADPFDVMGVVQHDRRVQSTDHLDPSMKPFAGRCVPKDTRELANAFPDASLLREILALNDRFAREPAPLDAPVQ